MRAVRLSLCLLISTLAACSSEPKPIDFGEIQRRAAVMEREGDVLMAKWTKCQNDATRDLARTKIPTEEVAQKAFQMCHAQREAWVDSQVGPGMSRQFVEHVADGAEHCSYLILTGWVGLLRGGASKEDIRLWALTHDAGSCRS
jgi:hypothetical protein